MEAFVHSTDIADACRPSDAACAGQMGPNKATYPVITPTNHKDCVGGRMWVRRRSSMPFLGRLIGVY